MNQRVLVVGNNAGEAANIIDGTISCVNRDAPEYAGPYSDFNISYYVAHMKAGGGISGSPAVGEDGLVMGVVSGGMTDGAICYLLPIRPVARALQCLQQGRSVARGDLQCRFTLTPLHECRALGLDAEWEGRLRRKVAQSGGLLVARDVLAGGPSGGRIAPGDILLEVDGAIALQFDELETILNDNVDGQVPVSLLRGGELVLAILDVVNLHHTVPRRLVSFGGLFCHDLSYLQAIQHSAAAARGVYVAESQEPLMIGDGEAGWLVQKLNGEPVHGVDEFLDRLRACNKGQDVLVTYAHIESPHPSSTSLVTFDAPAEIAIFSLDEATGLWERDTARLRPAKLALARPLVADRTTFERFPNVLGNLIGVESRSYIPLDGYPAMLARGMGVIVDARAGLAVVSRKVVPHKACYITVTLGSRAHVKARCLLLHMPHCYAVIQYDASLVPRPAAGIPLGGRPRYGAEASFISFHGPEQALCGDAPVHSVVLTRSVRRPGASHLRCYAVNADLVGMEAAPEIKRVDGVVVGPDGSVHAVWMPGIGGLAAESIAKILARLDSEPSPALYVLPAEVEIIAARHARILGVPEELVQAVVESHRDADLFMVKGAFSDQLQEGDIFMELNGKRPTRWADFDVRDAGTMPARVWREGGPRDLVLSCVRVDDMQTTRCVEVCGAFIQPTPLTVQWWLHLGEPAPSRGIYITDVPAGSTADLFALPAESFVTKLNGKAPRDFDAFVAMAKALPDEQPFTLTTVTLGGRKSVCILRPNKGHHPFAEWVFDGIEFVKK